MNTAQHYFMFNTLAPPTAVSLSLTAHLTSFSNHLVVSKGNILEIYSINKEGLLPLCLKKYPHTIQLLLKYAPSKDNCEYLIVLTSSYTLEVLKLTSNSLHVLTTGSIADRFGRKAYFGVKGIVSVDNRHCIINLYEQLLKFVKLPQYPSDELTASNVKIGHSRIVDMSFCQIEDTVELAILHESKRDIRHVDTYFIEPSNELKEGSFHQPNVGQTTSRVIGLMHGVRGLVVVSDETACYFNGGGKHALVNIGSRTVTAVCMLSKEHFIITDSTNALYHIQMDISVRNEVDVINCTRGITLKSMASTVSHIDGDIVFWGSMTGNSYIVTLEGDIIEEWENAGSILDMKPVDNRSNYVIHCNGGGEGCIGVVEKGSGVNDMGSLDIPDVKRISSFTLKKRLYIVVHTKTSTILCECIKNKRVIDVREVALPQLTEDTIVDIFPVSDSIVIVTDKSIYALKESTNKRKQPAAKLIHTFQGDIITHAASKNGVVYLVCRDTLWRLSKALEEELMTKLESDATALYVTDTVTVGLWDGTVLSVGFDGEVKDVYKLPHGVARSICVDNNMLYAVFEQELFSCDTSRMDTLKESRPFEVRKINTTRQAKVSLVHGVLVVISDKPSTLQTSGMVPLAIDGMVDICEVDIGIGGVAVATERGLVIGELSPLSRATIRRAPCGENNGRLATSGTSGLLVGRTVRHINLLDGTTSETQIDLRKDEVALTVDSLGDGVYAIGTATIKDNEVEPSAGRIILAKEIDGLVYSVCEKEYEGAVYCLRKYQSGIAALINRNIHIIERSGENLVTKQNTVLTLIGVSMCVSGDFIVVGDLMRSLTVYTYNQDLSRLEIVCSDTNVSWTTAVGMIPSSRVSNYVSVDTDGNALIYLPCTEALTVGEAAMIKTAQMNLPDMVNIIEKSFYEGVICGGLSGALYNICEISSDEYSFLQKLQRLLVRDSWHSLINKDECSVLNFIDGDKIENVLDWPTPQLERLSAKLSMSPGDVISGILSIFNRVFH